MGMSIGQRRPMRKMQILQGGTKLQKGGQENVWFENVLNVRNGQRDGLMSLQNSSECVGSGDRSVLDGILVFGLMAVLAVSLVNGLYQFCRV